MRLKGGTGTDKRPISKLAVYIGQRLLEARRAERLTLRDLHRATRISLSHLCNVENGVQEIGVYRLYVLARVLRKTPGWFFDGFDPEGKFR
jgi:transcriptional regulator with XRE-family HTH domain